MAWRLQNPVAAARKRRFDSFQGWVSMSELGQAPGVRIGTAEAAPASDGTQVAARTAVVGDFAASELFDRTFREGMALVEDAAAYLDGAGRQDSKALSRDAALAYAGQSMRLTTRLMQVASWLLVQRAVREGNMAAVDACHARYRLDAASPKDAADGGTDVGTDALPDGLCDLAQRAERLHGRVLHLDRRIYLEAAAPADEHPVRAQHDRLLAAFGG